MAAEQELLQFETDWNRAMERNNAEEIGFFMADDWIIVGAQGITTKEQFLAVVRSGDLSHSRMDADETHVRVYGDMGIITSRGTSAGVFKGQAFLLYEWSTSTFVHRNGRWLCVATMLTEVAK